MKKRAKKYDLEDRLVSFAVHVSRIAERLPDTRLGRHVCEQLIRCGTSAGPHYGEAQSAESRRDFIHKMKICLKELRETRGWLKFLRCRELDKTQELLETLTESNELVRIFVRSVATAEKNAARYRRTGIHGRSVSRKSAL